MNEDTLNGYGRRLNMVENQQAAQGVQVGTNEKQIDKIWLGIGEMQKAINGMLWKVFGLISVPTLLLAVKLVSDWNVK